MQKHVSAPYIVRRFLCIPIPNTRTASLQRCSMIRRFYWNSTKSILFSKPAVTIFHIRFGKIPSVIYKEICSKILFCKFGKIGAARVFVCTLFQILPFFPVFRNSWAFMMKAACFGLFHYNSTETNYIPRRYQK